MFKVKIWLNFWEGEMCPRRTNDLALINHWEIYSRK